MDWAVSLSKRMMILLCCLLGCASLAAQEIPVSRFQPGETVNYQLYFKWGLIMAKAGEATLSVDKASFQNQPAWHYSLLFKTNGLFERVYRMRDTLACFYSYDKGRLQYSSKHSDDGDYYSIDELTFSYVKDQVLVHSKRYTPTRVKIDTLLTAEGNVHDMLSATMYLRSLDWNRLTIGHECPFLIAVGRDMVRTAFRYEGQQVIERDGVKYRTRHFYVDVYDEAFTQSKAAGEVWIGDDENHIPVKIRAKLKIGAAEVYYKSSRNLKYPFSCGISATK